MPLLSLLPAVLSIITHSGLRPQTPPSHHLSCFCHSHFCHDLSLSCLPVKSAAWISFLLQVKKKINVCPPRLKISRIPLDQSIFYSHCVEKAAESLHSAAVYDVRLCNLVPKKDCFAGLGSDSLETKKKKKKKKKGSIIRLRSDAWRRLLSM